MDRCATYSETEERGEAETDSDGPSHALFTLSQGEDLGGVHEGNRSFADGIEGGEEVDKADHQY